MLTKIMIGFLVGVLVLVIPSFLYFAIVSTGEDNDTLIYQFMKDTFTERGDKKRLNKLEQIVDKKDNGKVECHNWYEFVALLHEAGGGTIMN